MLKRLHIELKNATEDNYVALREALELEGFSPAHKTDRAAHYTFDGDLSIHTGAKLVQRLAMNTGKRFFAFGSNSTGTTGFGISG